MPVNYQYFTPAKKTRCRFSVQGSRFIGTLAPAESESIAMKIIDAVGAEFPDATHHAYALRLGSGSVLIERFSDDREPAGTAGAPMLQVLKGQKLSDVLVIGTRYFGGTKLGIGGLTRAYRECARSSISEAVLVKKEALLLYDLKLHYQDLGAVTRVLKSHEGAVIFSEFGENVNLTISLPLRLTESFIARIKEVCCGRGSHAIREGFR